MPNIYCYNNAVEYLRDVYKYKKKINPNYSLRAWSKKMGFKSHTPLVLILNKKRDVSPKQIKKLLAGMDLDNNEAIYFEALAHMDACKSASQKEMYEAVLQNHHPDNDFSSMELEKFRMIANWYYAAIIEMTELKDFKADPVWISKRLGNKIDANEAQLALEKLLDFGLLKKRGRKLVKVNKSLTTPRNIGGEAIRKHHKEMIDLANKSVDEQKASERVLNSCSMTIDSSQIEKAQDLILKFRKNMEKTLETPKGDHTYQLCVQFFRLTEDIKK